VVSEIAGVALQRLEPAPDYTMAVVLLEGG
jgi:hypothetical protein